MFHVQGIHYLFKLGIAAKACNLLPDLDVKLSGKRVGTEDRQTCRSRLLITASV
jgi:hypothetical protein